MRGWRHVSCGRRVQLRNLSMIRIRAVAFDFGHTLVDERMEASIPLESRPVHLMPEVAKILPQIEMPMAVWANTRTATDAGLRVLLERAGILPFFTWVVTSVDAGFRKPAPEFFDFAVSKCGLAREELVFVGNQLNTDILGGQRYGIRTVWLSGNTYRSVDETFSLRDVQPTFAIRSLEELPALLKRICAEE